MADRVPQERMGCLGCDGLYEVGLSRCPLCGTRSPMFTGLVEGGSGMPKGTTGGSSNAWEPVGEVAEPVVVAEVAAEVVAVPVKVSQRKSVEPVEPVSAAKAVPSVPTETIPVPAASADPVAAPAAAKGGTL